VVAAASRATETAGRAPVALRGTPESETRVLLSRLCAVSLLPSRATRAWSLLRRNVHPRPKMLHCAHPCSRDAPLPRPLHEALAPRAPLRRLGLVPAKDGKRVEQKHR
jgi:hypothetical protein